VKDFASGKVRARTPGGRAAALLLRSAMRRLIVNPVLFCVIHSRGGGGDRPCRPSLVEPARQRTVTEGLSSVAAPTRVPLVDDHLDRPPASPDAVPALLQEGARSKSPMTPLAVDRKRGRNTAPRRRRCLVLRPGGTTRGACHDTGARCSRRSSSVVRIRGRRMK
jgi:hypothetical protein